MLHVKDLKTLRKLTTNNKIDEIAIVEETRMLYKWDGAHWNHYKNPKGVNVSLYELNQSAMHAMPVMSDIDIETAKASIKEFINTSNDTYFMLLSNDKHYYTIFHRIANASLNSYPEVENEIIECLQSQGSIKAIECEDNKIECWVSDDTNAYVYYLFPYDKGVIVCQ